jgi:hypothetical protein
MFVHNKRMQFFSFWEDRYLKVSFIIMLGPAYVKSTIDCFTMLHMKPWLFLCQQVDITHNTQKTKIESIENCTVHILRNGN